MLENVFKCNIIEANFFTFKICTKRKPTNNVRVENLRNNVYISEISTLLDEYS